MESIRVDKEYSRTPKPSSHKQDSAIISLKNIHKTYLMGIEGVPALRYMFHFIVRQTFFIDLVEVSPLKYIKESLSLSTELQAVERHRY